MACPNCGTHSAHVSLTQCVDALNDRLRAYEGSLPLDEQRELQVLLRQQGNELEGLRGEVARLTRELGDVRKLDEWADTHGEQWSTRKETDVDDGEAFVVVLGFDEDGYYCGENPSLARRAAVEYLEREQGGEET